MLDNKLIPHFVADRPMSLRILSGLNLKRHNVNVGLMVQACSSQNFRKLVAQFPCGDKNYCGVVDGPCPFNGNIKKCKNGIALRENLTTIADSGVFTKGGSSLKYSELFKRYEQMKIERGIILDVLGNKNKTIESAQLGWDFYKDHGYTFKLIGVAQGKNLGDYISCYQKLLDIGYDEIAIGGLLTKHQNTARFASSKRDEISKIVRAIKKEWPDQRCFTLGVYNPKRHGFLEELGVNGADYKGWIFQYEKRYFVDPICHHIDRIFQTREFIDKNILCKMSGKRKSSQCIHNLAQTMKSKLTTRNSRVFIQVENSNNLNKQPMDNHLVIIACGKSKNHGPNCKAKDAYNGQSFLLKKKYAELSGNSWLILSAKYGLLKPDKKINPNYDMTISTKGDVQQLTSKIIKQIPDFLEFSVADKIIFLGPRTYVESLQLALRGKTTVPIIHITKGLGQGKAKKKIIELINQIQSNEMLIA